MAGTDIRENYRPLGVGHAGGRVKPPLAYFGGKTRLAPRVAALLPPHRHYVEPYCGSLAVLLAKPRGPMETVNDLDEALMRFWRVLRDRPDELARVCQLTPHARVEHRAAYDLDDEPSGLELARRVWVQLTQGRAGTRRRTGWRHYVKPVGNTSMPDYLDAYVERMAAAAARLHEVSLESGPALDLISKYGDQPDVCLYVDPPYLGGTRCRSWDGYPHEMRHERDHRELAEALHAVRAAVVLSGYASDLYDRELYRDWSRTTMISGTGQGEGWGNRTEVLWSNRPFAVPPTEQRSPARQAA
jgi:DNA adenine methylase